MRRLTLTLWLFAAYSIGTAVAIELPIAIQSHDRTTPVDFDAEIMPLLRRSCLACHHAKKAEGGLVLESVPSLTKGGDSGAAVIAKDSASSLLLSRTSGETEPLMPPDDNTIGAKPFSSAELGLIKLWIDQGANASSPQKPVPLDWQPIAPTLQPIYAVAASGDGRFTAAGRGNRVTIYDLATGEERGVLNDPALPTPATDFDIVQSIAISPDGNRIATGGFRTVKLWRRIDRKVDVTQTPLVYPGGLVVINQEASRFAWINAIGDIEVWDMTANRRITAIQGQEAEVIALALDSAGTRLFAVDAGGGLIVSDASDGREMTRFQTNLSVVVMAAADNGELVTIIDADRHVRLFRCEAVGDKPQVAITAIEHQAIAGIADATSVLFTRDPSPAVAIGTQSGNVLIISTDSGQLVRTISHGNPVTALALTDDASRIAIAGRDGRTRLVSLANGETSITMESNARYAFPLLVAQRDVARHEAEIARQAARMTELDTFATNEVAAQAKVQPERNKLAEQLIADEMKLTEAVASVTSTEAMIAQSKLELESATEQGEAAQKIVDDTTGRITSLNAELEKLKSAHAIADQQKTKTSLALKQIDKSLASIGEATERAKTAIPVQAELVSLQNRLSMQSEERLIELELQSTSAQSPATSIVCGTQWVATSHMDGAVLCYRLADGKLVGDIQTVQKRSLDSAITGLVKVDSQTICLSLRKGTPMLWSTLVDWELERMIGGPDQTTISDRVTAIDFRPDGLSIAIGSGPPSRFGEVKVFSITNGELLRDFIDIHGDTVLGVRFSPDGRTIASASADRTAKVLDVASGNLLQTLEGHTHHVLAVAWQADGIGLATASADRNVKVWDSSSGTLRRTISSFPKEVTSLIYAGDTAQIITACADGQVRVYKTDNGGLVRTMNSMGDCLHSISTSLDAQFVISGGQNGQHQIWSLESGKLIREVK